MAEENTYKSCSTTIKFILKNYLIFGFFWIFSISILYIKEVLELSSLSVLFGVINFYITFSLSFLICKKLYLREVNLDLVFLKTIVYSSLILYFIVIFIRTFILDNEVNGIFALRFSYGFIFPFWILSPLFNIDPLKKINIYLCIFICIFESIFWLLFFKLTQSHLYENSGFIYLVLCSILFSIIFPFLFLGIEKIKLNKFTISENKENLFFKFISWISIVLGFIFMIAFFLVF